MNSTPNANRKHIGIFGKTNSGKSSLINCLVGQNVSIVSEKEGTTTDPVQKAMEFLPYGPVLFIDTAGLGDETSLGDERVKKTLEIIKRTDLGIYVMDGATLDDKEYKAWKIEMKKYNTPHILVISKSDIVSKEEWIQDGIKISTATGYGIETLKEEIIKLLKDDEEEIPIVGDLVPYNGKVILVVPIDSEAPKGRLILPQVQVIRDCLDHGIKSYVLRDTELEEGLKDLKDVDLVITDSQAFKEVDKLVPKEIRLTSFSILFARHKGDINEFVKGVEKVRTLKPGDKILISESCTHNVSHEDIGRVKIPKLLNKYVGGELNYEYRVGHEFPEDINKYDLIIHCGACMINRKTVLNRIEECNKKGVSITNYGIILAYLTGILERANIIN